MPIVLAHRGNTSGPSSIAENRRPTIAAALTRGWSIETDIRRDADGRFYIAHDPRPSAGEALADDFCALFRAHPEATIALNLKELGYEAELLEYLDRQHVLEQVFLFDMELIEPRAGATAATFRRLHPRVRLAARVSDRSEPIEQALAIGSASTIWLDEFDGPWCQAADVQRLKQAGRLLFAVSPDLHGASLSVSGRRWLDFIAWGVDGICTDYPEELARVLRDSEERAA